jgi:GT2 family glycosyltransferase
LKKILKKKLFQKFFLKSPKATGFSGMNLTISIVNHNNRAMLERCLAAVFAGTRNLEFEVYVVDNKSEDGSAEMVRDKFPRVKLIENETREGFAANQNKVLKRAAGEFVALLNNDAEVKPGALEILVDFMRRNPDAGLAGPRLLNPDSSLQQSCYRTPTLAVLFFDATFLSSVFPRSVVFGGYKSWAHDSVRKVQSMTLACAVARREAIEKAGPLDERFFMYFEDHDWCLRFRRAGWRIWLAPDAEAIHSGGGSEGLLGHDRFDRFYTSMNLFYEKHYGKWSLPVVAALNIAASALRLAAWAALSPFSKSIRVNNLSRAPYFRRRIAWYMGKRESL